VGEIPHFYFLEEIFYIFNRILYFTPTEIQRDHRNNNIKINFNKNIISVVDMRRNKKRKRSI
jgi:hypothetical protein